MKPRLSIVIPVYNGENYIDNIISAFNVQSDSGFELVFVDDGSKDNSYKKLSMLPENEKYGIKVIHQENAGVSSARNKGIENAEGDYITFVDVDDYVTDDYISFIMRGIENSDADTFVFQSYRIRDGLAYNIPQNSNNEFEAISSVDILKKFVQNPTDFAVYNVIIKREIIEKHSLLFSVGYKYYEDYDYLIRLFSVCGQIEFTDRMLYFYVLREGSAMATFVTDRLSCISLLEGLKPFVKANCPDFLPIFEKWMISRIYWSIMWQACHAFSYKDIVGFAKKAFIKKHMRNLYDYPDKKVSLSARLFNFSIFFYVLAVGFLGRNKTKVKKTDAKPFLDYLAAKPNRILVYGMTDNLGGIETYLMNQLASLDRTKAVFDFVVDFPTMAYSEKATDLGSKIHFIPAKSKGVFSQWKAFYKVLKLHPEYKKIYFNILDAGAAVTMLIPWIMGREIIAHSHNGSTDKLKLHKICRPFLKFFTSKRYACSNIAAEYMFGKRHNALIIPNAIDTDKYDFNKNVRDSKRKELGIENKFVICHIGRLSLQKNPKGLIEIFDKLVEKDLSATLLSIGSGEMDNEIFEFAKSKKCYEFIRFLGKRNDVPQILQAADVFVLPSFYEGLPLVAIEAQAAALPCLVSENISKEVALTKNIKFLSIENNTENWVNEILKLKDFVRISTKDEIINLGYDINHPSKSQYELMRYFEEK